MSDNPRPEADIPERKRPELTGPENDAIEAEAATAAAASDTFEQAADGIVDRDNFVPAEHVAQQSPETPPAEPESQPAPRLERLQKILAQAGIASRRHAEELITQGRVQVNGTIVTELGSKADAARDHIRVDGKLLQGSERLRYFMLNKPKGFVTTVSDPEGRPTVMQFFGKMRERLYPVGRLDYSSEGLLLVTNDGELANKLTRAASGVEKTYLVKISGQPSERDLDRLREGVGIDRGKPGSGRVHTAPAQIRRFHPGKGAGQRSGSQRGAENPWFEVVIIEGRNRELRKMFEEIGHHVEKIRRVGYGPLVLDIEPGKMRELEPEEVENLRKAAEGKYRKPKTRDTHKHTARPEPPRRDAKPRWKSRGGEDREQRSGFRPPERTGGGGPGRPGRPGRPERGAFRRPERDQSGESQRPERGEFRGRPRNEFHSKPRFEETRPQRPPRREGSDRTGARPNRSYRDEAEASRGFERREGRSSGGFRSGSRQAGSPKRFGGKRSSFERGGSAPRFNTTRRPPFTRDREQNPETGPRFDRDRDRAPKHASRSDRERDPEQRPRFEGRGAGRPERQREGRPGRSDRPQGERRPSRFDRPGAPERGKGSKPGSVRSGGGRRPSSRPDRPGRPGGKPKPGKRRG